MCFSIIIKFRISFIKKLLAHLYVKCRTPTVVYQQRINVDNIKLKKKKKKNLFLTNVRVVSTNAWFHNKHRDRTSGVLKRTK